MWPFVCFVSGITILKFHENIHIGMFSRTLYVISAANGRILNVKKCK